MTRNTHKVYKSQWNEWSESARSVFNYVYSTMSDQSLFQHPKTTKIAGDQWNTTRWNAAWIAAEAATVLVGKR